MPTNCKWLPKTDKDVEMFFEWSEQGKHKDRQMVGDLSYFEGLRQGKRWAGIHIHEMYEKGVSDKSMPYYVLLGGYEDEEPMPRQVVDFLKKEMFKGHDAELIEKVYNEITENNAKK